MNDMLKKRKVLFFFHKEANPKNAKNKVKIDNPINAPNEVHNSPKAGFFIKNSKVTDKFNINIEIKVVMVEIINK